MMICLLCQHRKYQWINNMSLQNVVKLEPVSHRYFHLDGREFTSVSKVLNSITPQENWDAIAGKVAGRGKFAMMSKAQVLELWDVNKNQSLQFGTHIHEALERYCKTFEILDADKDLEPMVKSIQSQYVEYYRAMDEVCLYSEKYGVAGTTDKRLQLKKNINVIDFGDYKTSFNKGKISYRNKDNKYLLYPVQHLQDCSYSRYCLQLSMYAVMEEELTGAKIGQLWITYILNDLTHERISVPYLKSDAIAVLENYQAQQNNMISIRAINNIFKPEEAMEEPTF